MLTKHKYVIGLVAATTLFTVIAIVLFCVGMLVDIKIDTPIGSTEIGSISSIMDDFNKSISFATSFKINLFDMYSFIRIENAEIQLIENMSWNGMQVVNTAIAGFSFFIIAIFTTVSSVLVFFSERTPE